MTVKNVVDRVMALKPSPYQEEDLVTWLNEAEGTIALDVNLLSAADVPQYSWDTDKSVVLLVGKPFERIYTLYLMAMIDFHNGEYSKYQNSFALFNSVLGDYSRWFARTYRPSLGGSSEEGYCVSAYAIAVKHGFSGTEEEWLSSLKGDRGEGLNVLGHFASLSDLEEAVSSPAEGDTYTVSDSVTLYRYDGESFVQGGSLRGPKGDDGGLTSHRENHATGGSDALSPEDIGAESAGSVNTHDLDALAHESLFASKMNDIPVSASDNGKFMIVKNGQWCAESMDVWSGGSY